MVDGEPGEKGARAIRFSEIRESGTGVQCIKCGTHILLYPARYWNDNTVVKCQHCGRWRCKTCDIHFEKSWTCWIREVKNETGMETPKEIGDSGPSGLQDLPEGTGRS